MQPARHKKILRNPARFRRGCPLLREAHQGYGFPIGGVAATDIEDNGVVSPGGVGYDINCGVRVIKTNLERKDAESKIKELTKEMFDNVPSGLDLREKLNSQLETWTEFFPRALAGLLKTVSDGKRTL